MQKLKLSLQHLVVKTFEPEVEARAPGTVRAQQSGPYTDGCYSCGVNTGCEAHGYRQSESCSTPGCQTASCPGYYTCVDGYTCGEGVSCVWPACTAYGNIC